MGFEDIGLGGRVAVGEFNGVGYLIIGGALDKFYKVRT